MGNYTKFNEAIKKCKKNSFITINGKKEKVNNLYGYLEDKNNLYLLYSDYSDKKTIFTSMFSFIQNIKIVKYIDSDNNGIYCSFLNKDEFSEITRRILSQIENQIK